jgi:hypothetical protein
MFALAPTIVAAMAIHGESHKRSFRMRPPLWYQRTDTTHASACPPTFDGQETPTSVRGSMRHFVRAALLATVATALATPAILQAQTVGSVQLSPTTVPVGVATSVSVTAVITDPALLPASVIVQRYDSAGRVLGTLGTMTDTGLNGDAVAGDRIFTLRQTIYELAPATTTLRVSAAFSGRVRRTLSAPVVLSIVGESSTVRITSPPPSRSTGLPPP